MTNATETQESVKIRTLDNVKSDLATAQSAQETSKSDFAAMVAAGGAGKSTEEQFAIFDAVKTADANVAKFETELSRFEKNAKATVVNELLNPMHDAIASLFDTAVCESIRDAEVGNAITFTVTLSEAGNPPAINHRTSAGATSTPAPSGSGTSNGTGGGSRGRFTWDGMSAPDYLLAHGSDEIKAHVQKVQNKEVGYNDLSKRADSLAEQMGHEKVRIN